MNDHKDPSKSSSSKDSKLEEEYLKQAQALYDAKNYKAAFALHQKMANQGNAKALNECGISYNHAHGVEQDYKKAVEYYQKAADKGEANAQYNLGLMYFHGHGVKKNFKKVFELFSKAADQNLVEAIVGLAVLYKNGFGVNKNEKLAAELLRRAIEIDDASYAYLQLGLCYFYGSGVEKDEKKAVYYLRQAYDRGDDNALPSLMDMYNRGLGKPDIIYHLALIIADRRYDDDKARVVVEEFFRLASQILSKETHETTESAQLTESKTTAKPSDSLFYRLLTEFPQDLERLKKHYPKVYNDFMSSFSSNMEMVAALQTHTPLPPDLRNIILDLLIPEGPKSAMIKKETARILEKESELKRQEEALKLTGQAVKAKQTAEEVGNTVEAVKKRVEEAHLKAAQLLGDLSFIAPKESQSPSPKDNQSPATKAPLKPLSKNR